MSGYAFEFQGKGFMPDGSEPLPASDVESRNRETERQEIEWLKTGPAEESETSSFTEELEIRC